MSDTEALEETLPRWILDQPTEADLAPEGTLEDCAGSSAETLTDDHDVEAMAGVKLPDNLAATEDYGDDGLDPDDDAEDDDDG